MEIITTLEQQHIAIQAIFLPETLINTTNIDNSVTPGYKIHHFIRNNIKEYGVTLYTVV